MAKRPDDYSLVVFRDPETRITITPTLFAQLPERDYMDHETGLLIPSHQLHGRVVWHGSIWLIFTDSEDPRPALYRYLLKPDVTPSIELESSNESYRLARVVEAIRVRDNRMEELPVRLKVHGRVHYLAIYHHPCFEVRYPYMGLTPDGFVGAAKHDEVCRWIESQGFAADITEGEVVGLMESVITACEKRLVAWRDTREQLARTGQLFLHPDADELHVTQVLDTIRRKQS